MGEHSEDAVYLELIYNLHSICEALAFDGLESACAMLKERIKHVAAMHGGIIPTIDGMILVTSLNRGLYDFFQFYLHISFTKCCYENRVHLELMQNNDAIYRAGLKVLTDYDRALSENREICSHMEKARSYIREHLAEKLTLTIVAKAVHISSSYLSRIFSTLAGQSFCDYICDERMTLARQLLNKTDDSIDEISNRCGFSSPNYFSMMFKKKAWVKPLPLIEKTKERISIETCRNSCLQIRLPMRNGRRYHWVLPPAANSGSNAHWVDQIALLRFAVFLPVSIPDVHWRKERFIACSEFSPILPDQESRSLADDKI